MLLFHSLNNGGNARNQLVLLAARLVRVHATLDAVQKVVVELAEERRLGTLRGVHAANVRTKHLGK